MADDENTTSDSAPPGWPFNEQPPAIPPAQSPPSLQPPSFEPPSLPAQQSPPSAFVPPSLPTQQPPPPGAQPPPPYVAPTPQPGYNQPGYNSPGQPPPPTAAWAPGVPQKSSRKSVWMTLAIVVGALALGIGACTIWFVGAVKAPVDASNQFLAFVDRGDYVSASALVSLECSGGGITPQELRNAFSQEPISYNLSSSSVSNNDATVSGSFSSDAVSGNRIELFLRQTGDDWNVCGFQFP